MDADKVRAYLPLSGQAITHSTIRGDKGFSRTQPIIDQYAPVHHVRADAPPFILITGGSRGFGWFIAEKLLSFGAKVAITASNPSKQLQDAKSKHEFIDETRAKSLAYGGEILMANIMSIILKQTIFQV